MGKELTKKVLFTETVLLRRESVFDSDSPAVFEVCRHPSDHGQSGVLFRGVLGRSGVRRMFEIPGRRSVATFEKYAQGNAKHKVADVVARAESFGIQALSRRDCEDVC